MRNPDYIFETSWEVCNKVGGIYAVLSTKARTMQAEHPDHVIFLGPDLHQHSDIYFRPDPQLLQDWYRQLDDESPLRRCRIGRWNIPGQPIAVLVDYNHLWQRKNEIYGWAWQEFGIQSHAAYGDYDDSCLFGYAVGQVIESIHSYLTSRHPAADMNTVAHAHEWQTAFTLFYLHHHCPRIATLFTTHATGIGRSIAGNGKPLYDYFTGYHGDQMAEELNMVSKHSAEKGAARWADCFTTVSELTARECRQLLEKPVDIVTPNGFEPDFIPEPALYRRKRKLARQTLIRIAEQLLHREMNPDAMLIATAGRPEWKNKGVDIYLDAISRYRDNCNQDIIAFVMIPFIDRPSCSVSEHVHLVYLPYYLDGTDPLIGMSYYDLLIGLDLTVFASYYEPWGYTPLESAAFAIPTITTSLSGFGLWVKSVSVDPERAENMKDGIAVVTRIDSNREAVVDRISSLIAYYGNMDETERKALGRSAARIAAKAEWKNFYVAYRKAYDIALSKANLRKNA